MASYPNSIEDALAALSAGRFVIVTDDSNRENEGDLILSAQMATPAAIGFMVRHTSGVICVSMEEERLHALQLPQMVSHNTEAKRTAFTVSVDAAKGTSTGISAHDRALTIQTLVDPHAVADDLRRPGHIFPLCYQKGGVLTRAGHTEAAVDLVRLAGLRPVGVLCELVNDDGSMMRTPELEVFARQHDIPFITIEDLIKYRRRHENHVTRVTQTRLPTSAGEFQAYAYHSNINSIEHVALVKGNVQGAENVLVRVHSECMTGDIFGSLRCDCGPQLSLAMQRIAEAECGIVIYLRGHEGRGIGIAHKLRAYNLQDQGRDTVEANLELGLPVDAREYSIAAHILRDLDVRSIRLLSNNPAKFSGLESLNLKIAGREPLVANKHDENLFYLLTKKNKMGHFLEL